LIKKMIKKFVIIVAGIYFSLGFVMASYFYIKELQTFDCFDPNTQQSIGGGGEFFTNPNPELCTRRGFTLQSGINFATLTVLGVPLATAKYYYTKTENKRSLLEYKKVKYD